MKEEIKPFINIGPGQIIKKYMESLGWTLEMLAAKTGMSEDSINLLLKNEQSINDETGIILAGAFKTSPEFWLNLEQNYRLRKMGC